MLDGSQTNLFGTAAMYLHVPLVSLYFLFATFSLARVVERLPVNPNTTLLPRTDSPTCIELTPPPAGASCRVHGTSAYGCTQCFRPAPALVASFQDCAQLNYKHQASRFSYNNISSVCQLYHPYPDGKLAPIHPDPLSDTVFSDSRCYQCTHRCPSVQYTYQEIDNGKALSLIFNGGFENSKTIAQFGPWQRYYPYQRGIGYPRLVSPGYHSSQALQAVDRKPNLNLFEMIQRTRPCHNQSYLVKYNYKFSPSSYAPFGTYINAFFYSHYRYLPKRYTANDTSWQTAEFSLERNKHSFDSPQMVDITLFGKVEIDNIGVYPLKAPVTTGVNLIPNGDFESGHLAPWSSHLEDDSEPQSNPAPIFRVQSPGINSIYALSLTLPVPKNGTISGDGFIHQVFSVKPNTRYVFSFDYALKPAHRYFQIDINLFHYAGTSTHKSELTAHDQWSYGATESYQHYSQVFRSAGPTMRIHMSLYGPGNMRYETVNSIDNISVREVK